MLSLFTTRGRVVVTAGSLDLAQVAVVDVDRHFLHVPLADGVWGGQPPVLAHIAAHRNRIAVHSELPASFRFPGMFVLNSQGAVSPPFAPPCSDGQETGWTNVTAMR
eukprot:1186716-Prorocentrum_minimum.AAC.1